MHRYNYGKVYALLRKELSMITIDDFKKIELRVAQVKEVNDHPNADKLLVLTLDVGDKTKQVVVERPLKLGSIVK